MAENKDTIVCQNTIEMVSIVLLSDNDKNHWQKVVMTNTNDGRQREISVAPIDFFALASAIMCNDQLCDVIDDFSDTWTAETLETSIHMLCEEE